MGIWTFTTCPKEFGFLFLYVTVFVPLYDIVFIDIKTVCTATEAVPDYFAGRFMVSNQFSSVIILQATTQMNGVLFMASFFLNIFGI